jgi:putative inorganic carbon (HCO3(-)) transporter
MLAIALLLTASRGGALATVVGVVVIFATRGLSKRMLRMSLGLGVLGAVTVPLVLRFAGLFEKLHVDASALQRVVAWKRAVQVFAEHPIIGIGFNAWGFVQERYGYERLYAFSYSLDGGLIFIALMTGLVGLALYVAMLFAVLKRARRIWRDESRPVEERGLAIGVVAGTVALVVDSLFGNGLFLPFLMETMWVLFALVFAMSAGANGTARRPRIVTARTRFLAR